MISLRLNVSEDGQTIHGRHSRPSNSINATVENIPTDVMMDIFSRLSSKSIATCRCVSKLWVSILGIPYFTELFLTKSYALPRLLFVCEKDSELIVFSTPQPTNPYKHSSPLAATYHMKIPFGRYCDNIRPIHGLVFIRNEQRFKLESVICNPTTRQTLTLPKPKTRKRLRIHSYFGYDPMEKQFKVLSMTERDGISDEHQVLTLGAKKLSWRMIECCIPHHPKYEGICINGVLYYRASVDKSSNIFVIVCFDVRSEKFSFIKAMEPFIIDAHLINYNGKLGLVMSEGLPYISGRCRSFKMWVLKDSQKHGWFKNTYELPPLWQYEIAGELLHFVGVTGTTNEIVFSPTYLSYPFYVLYYSFEKKTIRKVRIQGMGGFKQNNWVQMFIDHVEDVRLM
ncbi:PREDICTED: F-box protein DOR-like [Camelina sativa]|uniref:F-box protein DOR-like n=1 Tax=Camelina sativa TaxID=90675 RepID=A0ABM0ZAU6_CAMSA|nr:PREDICTED: F-box protein DOR-like [Camelina sativa]